MPADPPAPLPSATVLLLRDGAHGLEVLMVQRHHQIDFASGALVFPGGKLDPGDGDPRLRERCAGAAHLDDAALALRVAALRECFEESGVLVARAPGRAELVGAARATEVDARWRAKLLAGQAGMADVVCAEDLVLACDLLVPFAHWITPEFMPKRFDTHFFLVPAPADQLAAHDGRESVDSLWIRPADAVEAERSGRRTIIFPTLQNVLKLGRCASVADAIAAARSGPIVSVLPRVEKRAGGPMLCIPPEAGYDAIEVPIEQAR
jgi:8-oxo-dGTP pyrophosphatase MutT (NUDIX family)